MYLGDEIKKLKFNTFFYIKYLFMIILSLVFGIFLTIGSIIHIDKNEDAKTVLLAGLLILFFGFIYFLLYKRVINKTGKYTLYKLGIKNDKNDKAVLFSDVDTFYVTEHLDYSMGKERIKYLILKSKNNEVFTITSQLKDGVKSVLNAYLLNVTKDKLEKLKNGQTEKFDVVSKFANIKRKFKLTNKQVEDSLINPEIVGEVLLTINGIRIIEKNSELYYSMDEIKKIENKDLSRIKIITDNGSKIIVVTRADLLTELVNRIKRS